MNQGRNALVHLVTGATGAGKTTYALELERELAAVRFSIDDWMTKLFWMDSPKPIQYDWTIQRIRRCEDQIADTMRRLGSLGVLSILDLGFTRADHRAKFATIAEEAGLLVRLHHIQVSPDERWSRVIGRNAERGATYQMDVNREMFDFMESIWEAPQPEEMSALNGVVV